MQNIENRIQHLNKIIAASQIKLERYRSLRLFVGLINIVLIVLIAMNIAPYITTIAFVICFAAFVYYVKLSKNWLTYIQRLIAYGKFHQELTNKKQNNFTGEANEVLPFNITFDQDNFCKDLHILGKHSVFQLFNFTVSPWGYSKLLSELIQPSIKSENEINSIYNKTQNLTSSRRLIKRIHSLNLNQEKKNVFFSFKTLFANSLLEKDFLKAYRVLIFLSLLNLTYIGLFLLGKVSLNPIPVMFLFMVINFSLSSRVKKPFKKALEFEQHLLNLKPISQEIENCATAEQIESLFPSLKQPLSKKLAQLDSLLSYLNAQSHPLLYLFVQALVPWDFYFGYKLEKWRLQVKDQLMEFEKQFTDFDLLMSYSCVTWIKTTCRPNFDNQSHWSIQQAYHPLLKEDTAIKNDFNFEDFHVAMLTGSNMAGKSTFMRTIALNQHLTLLGAPIFADQFTTTPAPVISCLHIKDAIEHGYSTFYFEVRKIKEIINKAQNHEHIFYFIDEIFRGTNNNERLIGSQSILRELLKHPSAKGIISTHDLELAQSEEGHPGVRNYHFTDEFDGQSLTFPYKVLPGLSQTTNALKIMQLEGLPID